MGADHGYGEWDRFPEGRDLLRPDEEAAFALGFVVAAFAGAIMGAAVTLLIVWLA